MMIVMMMIMMMMMNIDNDIDDTDDDYKSSDCSLAAHWLNCLDVAVQV